MCECPPFTNTEHYENVSPLFQAQSRNRTVSASNLLPDSPSWNRAAASRIINCKRNLRDGGGEPWMMTSLLFAPISIQVNISLHAFIPLILTQGSTLLNIILIVKIVLAHE